MKLGQLDRRRQWKLVTQSAFDAYMQGRCADASVLYDRGFQMALRFKPIIPGFLSDSCLDCLDYSEEKPEGFYLKSTIEVLITLLNEKQNSMEERQFLWDKLSVISNRFLSHLQAKGDFASARHYLMLVEQAFLRTSHQSTNQVPNQFMAKNCANRE